MKAKYVIAVSGNQLRMNLKARVFFIHCKRMCFSCDNPDITGRKTWSIILGFFSNKLNPRSTHTIMTDSYFIQTASSKTNKDNTYVLNSAISLLYNSHRYLEKKISPSTCISRTCNNVYQIGKLKNWHIKKKDLRSKKYLQARYFVKFAFVSVGEPIRPANWFQIRRTFSVFSALLSKHMNTLA